jgi:hypothetical protein
VDVKQIVLCPIYWGEWWMPANGNAYNWPQVSGLMANVVSGRYMDGLNQYGIGRGSISKTYVHQIDPPASGFGDSQVQWLFKTALDNGLILTPDYFDPSTQQPFYSLIVRPGVEHLRNAAPGVPQWTPDTGTGAYHFGFSYDYGDGRPAWQGQACWVKATPDIERTIRRWVHEMAEAHTAGKGEISDKCESDHPVLVDHVSVPQYWSDQDSSCWPPGDDLTSVSRAIEEGISATAPAADERMTGVGQVQTTGPHISP